MVVVVVVVVVVIVVVVVVWRGSCEYSWVVVLPEQYYAEIIVVL